MSYSFQVRKTKGTLELVTDYTSLTEVAKHIPDGAVFTINGHTPGPDTSSVGSLGVQLVTVDETANGARGTFVGAANVSFNITEG